VRTELIPNLDQTLASWRSNEQGDSAEEYYEPLMSALREYSWALEEDQAAVEAFNAALEKAERQCSEARYWQPDDEDEIEEEADDQQDAQTATSLSEPFHAGGEASGRDVFDDVDQ
jgi:hypothetical protein